jgi:Bacterial regulatory proteins, gntR family
VGHRDACCAYRGACASRCPGDNSSALVRVSVAWQPSSDRSAHTKGTAVLVAIGRQADSVTIGYTLTPMTDPLSEGRALDMSARMPPYLQLAQLLRQAIMSGYYQTNQVLPGEERLAETYRVSRDTVRAALAVMRSEGLVMTRRGAGSVVGAVPPRVTITVTAGDRFSSRMPTPDERGRLGIAEGVPVIAVKREGRPEELFDANRTEVVAG